MADQRAGTEVSERGSASILFVGKYGLEDGAGNAVAIRRLMAAFEARAAAPGRGSVKVRYVRSTESAGSAAFALFGFHPTVVHALHAGEAARFGKELARAFGVPLVVTVTGTDLNGSPEDVQEARARLGAADAVVALTQRQVQQLAEIVPSARVVKIPQTVQLGSEAFELREALAHVAGPDLAARKIALLAGGLRPVKGQLFALEAFEGAGAALDGWLLVLAGPILDPDYGAEVRERARSLDGAVYIGQIPHEAMASAMAASDALVNSSESEGEAQIILEAQCSSLPVIARRVVGNTALVEDGVTGWLFDDYMGLEGALQDVAANPERVAAVVARALAARSDRLHVQVEAEAHLALYEELTRGEP